MAPIRLGPETALTHPDPSHFLALIGELQDRFLAFLEEERHLLLLPLFILLLLLQKALLQRVSNQWASLGLKVLVVLVGGVLGVILVLNNARVHKLICIGRSVQALACDLLVGLNFIITHLTVAIRGHDVPLLYLRDVPRGRGNGLHD